MKTKNDPAYPLIEKGWDTNFNAEIEHVNPGITKLEYFAGLAMRGMCANDSIFWDLNQGADPQDIVNDMARKSFDIAEAMLKESEKRKGSWISL